MTPDRLRELRARRGWSQTDLAERMRLGVDGKRTVARWEAGGTIPGPTLVALEALEDGWTPGGGKWRDMRAEFISGLDHISEVVSEYRTKFCGNYRDDDASDQQR